METENAMKAKDLMTTELVTVGPDAAVSDAARAMVENRVSALPVIDDRGRLVGIVSEGDLMRRVEMGTDKRRPWWLAIVTGDETLAREFAKAHGRRVRDVMTADVITATEDWPVDRIARALEERHVKRLIIVREGKPVGVVSRADLLRALATRPQPAATVPTGEDRALRATVTAALARRDWGGGPAAPITVFVDDGVVHLWGLVDSEAVRDALRIAAEEVPGVKRVEIHLTVGDRNWGWGE